MGFRLTAEVIYLSQHILHPGTVEENLVPFRFSHRTNGELSVIRTQRRDSHDWRSSNCRRRYDQPCDSLAAVTTSHRFDSGWPSVSGTALGRTHSGGTDPDTRDRYEKQIHQWHGSSNVDMESDRVLLWTSHDISGPSNDPADCYAEENWV